MEYETRQRAHERGGHRPAVRSARKPLAGAAGAWPDGSDGDTASGNTGAAGVSIWAQVPLVFIAALVGAVYAPIAGSALADCWRDPNYSYGVLVPLVVLALVHQRHHDVFTGGGQEARSLRRFAWALVVAGCGLFVLGTAAAEQFTTRVSGVLLAAGLCGAVLGPRGMHRYALPVALLLFTVPLPYTAYYRVSFPLQLLSAKLAAWCLGVLGHAVARSGNILEVGGQALEVVTACSGIRSMMTLGTLAACAAVALRLTGLRTFVLLVLSLPVALLGNTIRLTGTALLVTRYGPQAAEGHVHAAVGVGSFLASLALLGGVAALLEIGNPGSRSVRSRRSRQGASRSRRAVDGTAPARSKAASQAGTAGADPRLAAAEAKLLLPEAESLAGEDSRHVPDAPRLAARRTHQGAWVWLRLLSPVSARAAWACVGIVALAGAYGTFLRLHTAEAGERPRLADLPLEFDGFTGEDIPLDDRVLDQVRADAHVFRTYSAQGAPEVALYVGYYASQRQGAQVHSPLHCYPGAGWKVEKVERMPVRDLDGNVTHMARLVVEREGERDVVLYWYDTRTGRLTNDVELKLNLMRTALLHRPQDAAFVRWSTTIQPTEDLDAATARLLTAVAHTLPRLQAALPFGS
jgi:EpsI family protein